uniref:Uncharacterized protein n=1 Tax=Solanum lycopersicum TaxID=4081 RepID=A0A3Q7IQ18_SOLLC
MGMLWFFLYINSPFAVCKLIDHFERWHSIHNHRQDGETCWDYSVVLEELKGVKLGPKTRELACGI